MPSGADLFADVLTVRQKANLSYWNYQHNLENRLFDELSNQDLQGVDGSHVGWTTTGIACSNWTWLGWKAIGIGNHRPKTGCRISCVNRSATGMPIQKNANPPRI